MLSVQLHQNDLMKGVILTIPNISINRSDLATQRYFKLVKAGDMRELQKSLREGAASVRDHDEDGKSLLFVSALEDSPHA